MLRSSLPSIGLLFLIGCSSDPATDNDDGGSGSQGVAGAAASPGGTSSGAAGSATQGGGTGTGQGGSGPAGQGGVSPSSGGASAGHPATSGGASGAPSSGGGGNQSAKGGSGGNASAGTPGTGGSGGTAGVASGGTGGGSSGSSGTDPLALYAAACAECHGDKGQGVTAKGPEIQHPVRDFSTWVVRNGRQGHPSFAGSAMAAFPESVISKEALDAIFDSLSTPTIPKPTTGEALYADYCGTCHGTKGAGGPAGHNAKGEPLSKAISMVRSGHSLTQFSSRTSYMPKWTTSELSDAEVGLIVDFINGQ